jgi:hypothetical protein
LTIVLLCVSVSLAIAEARAEIVTLVPTQAIALPASESGASVALLFDVSALKIGDRAKTISEALLEWELTGMDAEIEYSFTVTQVMETWEPGAETGIEVADEAVASWTFEPLDYQRNGMGFVRFELSALVRDWTAGRVENFGVVISTPELDSSILSSQLAGPRLTVRYVP